MIKIIRSVLLLALSSCCFAQQDAPKLPDPAISLNQQQVTELTSYRLQIQVLNERIEQIRLRACMAVKVSEPECGRMDTSGRPFVQRVVVPVPHNNAPPLTPKSEK